MFNREDFISNLLNTDLEFAKNKYIKDIENETASFISNSVGSPPVIRETWVIQKEVALRVKSNTGTQEDTDFLTNIKIGTETVENIADKIIYKSNLTTTVISRAVGLMRTYTKQLESLVVGTNTPEEAKIIKEAFTLELLT